MGFFYTLALIPVFLCLIDARPQFGMVGGLSETKDATPEVQQLVSQLKQQVEGKVNQALSQFDAVSYRTQVVAGTNYFVKVQVSPSEYMHLRIYKPLPFMNQPASLAGVQTSKNKMDEIKYF